MLKVLVNMHLHQTTCGNKKPLDTLDSHIFSFKYSI